MPTKQPTGKKRKGKAGTAPAGRAVGPGEITTPRDHLSVIVALGKQLSTLAHPREQIHAYCTALKAIWTWVARVYVFFPPSPEQREPKILLYDRKAPGLEILGRHALSGEERSFFEAFIAGKASPLVLSSPGKAARGGKAPPRTKSKSAGRGHLSVRAAFPLPSASSETAPWVLVTTGEPGSRDPIGEADRNAVAVCTDMLGASLDRAVLFEKVLHAKREWERTADAIRDVVMIIDGEHHVRRGNRRLAELGDVPLERLQGSKCYRLLSSPGGVCPGCPALVTLETGEEATAEILRGTPEAVFQVWSYPILDPEGKIESVAVYEKEVTEYKKMQEQLVHAEKMGVLGQLAAAVAHELNNPLSGVISFSQILLKEMDPSLPYVEDLKNIEHAALRCKKIVEDLLSFARKPETAGTGPIDLREVIHQALTIMGPKLEERGTRVELDLPETFPDLPVHPDPVHQILVNLISNAHDAMEEGGVLRIGVRRALRDGMPHLLLTVQDTGSGIRPEDAERIFEPFFTTKSAGRGTGLGLSISRQLMEAMGGRIEVTSRPMEGTRFSLWFPLPEKAPSA